MRVMLICLIGILTFCDIFGVGLTLAPGMSLKNLFVYSAAASLLLRVLLGERIKPEMTGLQKVFGVMIVYALFSVLVATRVVEYPQYSMMRGFTTLKTNLIDWLILFVVFFYSVTTTREVVSLLKALMTAFVVGHLATLGVTLGLFDTGALDVVGGAQEEVSRVNGVFGDANETATLIAITLPTYLALAESSKGVERMYWIGGLLLSVVVMLMTGSRGALVGLVGGYLWAMTLVGRYVTMQKAAKWGWVIGIGMIPVLMFGGMKYWNMFVTRFTEVSMVSAADISSGRTAFWMLAIDKMFEYPLTLITGFGWNTWGVMDFTYAAHNEYLLLWFELGLVGLIGLMVIMALTIKVANRAARQATDEQARRFMIAYVFGMLSMAVGIFFVLLSKPMLYLWPFVGLMMRYAILSRPTVESVVAKHSGSEDPPRQRTRRSRPATDKHGWRAKAPRTAKVSAPS